MCDLCDPKAWMTVVQGSRPPAGVECPDALDASQNPMPLLLTEPQISHR